MKTILIFTNHPSPYRVYLFNKLNDLLSIKNIHLTVAFFSFMEKRRKWIVNEKEFKFNYIFLKPLTISNRNITFYFNSKVKYYYKIINPDIVILGGSWHYLDYFYFYFNKNIRSKIYIWTEINIYVNSNKLIMYLRNLFYRKIKHFIVPGDLNKLYIQKYIGKRKIIELPNMINENYFVNSPVKNNKITNILIVSRLEKEKNVINVIKILMKIIKKFSYSVKLNIIGNGSGRKLLEKIIKDKKYIKYIQFVPYKDIYKFYYEADLFILASYKDLSPLSNIEAICAGCILLISNRCGNITEVLAENKNGFSFDPYSDNDFTKKFMKIMKWNSKKVIDSKKVSKLLYRKYFSMNKIIKSFISQLNI